MKHVSGCPLSRAPPYLGVSGPIFRKYHYILGLDTCAILEAGHDRPRLHVIPTCNHWPLRKDVKRESVTCP
jgi:hypothetical protein